MDNPCCRISFHLNLGVIGIHLVILLLSFNIQMSQWLVWFALTWFFMSYDSACLLVLTWVLPFIFFNLNDSVKKTGLICLLRGEATNNVTVGYPYHWAIVFTFILWPVWPNGTRDSLLLFIIPLFPLPAARDLTGPTVACDLLGLGPFLRMKKSTTKP